jgi:transcription initiation factor TFIIB
MNLSSKKQIKKNCSLNKAFTMLHGMKTKLEISNNVVENAAYIYRKAVNAKLTRRRTMNSLIIASLYAACTKNNMRRTLDDIAGSENVERRILSQDLRTIIKKIELNLNQYDTALFISNNMSLKEKTKRDVFEISRH